MILYKSMHTIDVDNGKCIRLEIPKDFTAFIEKYIKYATQNDCELPR